MSEDTKLQEEIIFTIQIRELQNSSGFNKNSWMSSYPIYDIQRSNWQSNKTCYARFARLLRSQARLLNLLTPCWDSEIYEYVFTL